MTGTLPALSSVYSEMRRLLSSAVALLLLGATARAQEPTGVGGRCATPDTIVFHPLSRDHITQIVSVLLKDVRKRMAEDDLTIRLTESATALLVKHGYDESYGARPLKRSIQKFIEDPLSEKILLGEFSKGDEIEVDVSADGTKLDFKVLTDATRA